VAAAPPGSRQKPAGREFVVLQVQAQKNRTAAAEKQQAGPTQVQWQQQTSRQSRSGSPGAAYRQESAEQAAPPGRRQQAGRTVQAETPGAAERDDPGRTQ